MLTAEQLLRAPDRDGVIRFAHLDRFVAAFHYARQKVLEAALPASHDPVGRLPAAARDGFTRDPGVFIGEEFVRCLVGEIPPAPCVIHE